MPKLKEFDTLEVPLHGSNLIEASAGTGKTYSIAILVVRLIIEKDIKLNEILMVTFTKAAVAELEGRIRLFIREAYEYTFIQKDIDATIKHIVDRSIKTIGQNEVICRLNSAKRQLDETPIYTIHSFCQKTLAEYAFETGQLFGSEVIEDETELINNALNKYWRQNITTIEVERLQLILHNDLDKRQLFNVVKKALSGKEFSYNKSKSKDDLLETLDDIRASLTKLSDAFVDYFNQSKESKLDHFVKNKAAHNNFGVLVDSPIDFKNNLLKKSTTKYVLKMFPNLLEQAELHQEEENRLNESINEVIYFLYGEAIDYTKNIIEKLKEQLTLFSFNDLIEKLYTALSSKYSNQLKQAVQKKYKAAFIDEFQDTDEMQYDIFSSFFKDHITVFYIGDPKQAIYSFRGADIDTYKRAAQEVDYAYTMKHNYRSTPAYIEAMNDMFEAVDNPFYDKSIQYESVHAGVPREELTLNNENNTTIALSFCTKNNELVEQTAYNIHELLTNNYRIKGKHILPSDIGVLVRSKEKGNMIKRALAELNIPAITIDDSKVIESEEAEILSYILKATLEPSPANINKALLNKFTGIGKDVLLQNSGEHDLDNFKQLNNLWLQRGVFSALNKFLDLYNVRTILFTNDPNNAERTITNILQLNELLHNKEVFSQLSQKELLHWLISAPSKEDSDQYTQRLESDRDAVSIVTIHKSKGLSYNIVFAPFLDLKSDPIYTPIEYKNPQTNKYEFSYRNTIEEQNWYKEQTEAENRRLIYVALTRAVYKSYILHNTNTTHGCGSIKDFVDAAENNTSVEKCSLLDKPTERYTTIRQSKQNTSLTFQGNAQSAWQVTSFSKLSKTHYSYPSDHLEGTNVYDEFVFNELPKGIMAGHFLHDLMDNTNFITRNFEQAISTSAKRYPTVYNDEYNENYTSLIKHILEAELPCPTPFSLSKISNSDKRVEMEFYFNIKDLNTVKLAQITDAIGISKATDITGFMHGFIDLFFKHKGKYYILDWKSNYLGSDLSCYTHDKVEQAIKANNYQLQYHIYTIATIRYLKSVMPQFDYEEHFGGVLYFFLRGCRSETSSGVYYAKPEKSIIDQLDDIL